MTAVVLAWVLYAFLGLAEAQTPKYGGAGIFAVANCTEINGAIEGRTLCFESSTNQVKTYTDADGWVSVSPTPTFNGTPTMGTCGSGPSLGAGSMDGWGIVNIGTGIVTACTLNFSRTFATPPVCLITSNSALVAVMVSAVDTASVTFGFSATLGGGRVYYHCLGST